MIYLASPYSHPDPAVRQERYEAVCQAAAELISRGHIVFSPVAHSHTIATYGLPGDWEFWQRTDRIDGLHSGVIHPLIRSRTSR
jgi:hypothetical protein